MERIRRQSRNPAARPVLEVVEPPADDDDDDDDTVEETVTPDEPGTPVEGSPEGEARIVELTAMDRSELDSLALGLGIENLFNYSNDELVAAIIAKENES